MINRPRIFLLLITLTLTGCFTTPQWRVAQATVPAPVVKAPRQVEAERQAAHLIATQIEQPTSLIPVAQELSASLGEPKRPLSEPADVLAALHKGQLEQQAQFDRLNRTLTKHQGKEIEGTGVNLFAPTTGLGVVGLIAACIFVPGFLTFVLFVIKRLYGTLHVLVTKIKEFEVAEPEAAEKLKGSLSRGMDRAHKDLVRSLKV